jgi:glycosyltransferase involved in cell wall biosynthesis
MNSPVRNARSLFRRATLWAQRNSWRLPRGVRRAAKRLIMGNRPSWEGDGVVDDWSKPLVPYDSKSVPSVPDAYPAAPSDKLLLSAKPVSSPQRFHCLIVTTVLDAGGLDEIVAFLARRLPLMGFRVTVMCAQVSSDSETRSSVGLLATALQSEGVSVVVAAPTEAYRWLSENRPDVISAHAPPDWILETAHGAGIPIVETLHAIPTPISTDWTREGPRSKYITSFVAVSDLVRRQYLRGNPSFPEHAVVTIPNAFNETHRPLADRSMARAWLGLKDQFLFLTLGRHTVQKNAYGLVEAFSEVAEANPNAHLLFAGRLDDVVYTQQVCALRDKLPSKDRIYLRNSFPNPSLLLAAADCFVLNSFFEGWSLASMEALSAGLPVVMSEVGGAREQLGTDGSRGFVVANPVGNPEAANWETAGLMRFRPQPNKDELVAAMNSVVAHRNQWSAARRYLSEDSKGRFSAATCSQRHADILFQAISQYNVAV